MNARMKFVLTPLAAAVIGSLAVYGCGSGAEAPPPVPTATVVAPVVNTPLKDVTVTLTCADGKLGGTGTAVNGSVSILVQTTCATPFTLAVSGTGTMAGPDLVFGTADDEAYDSATRTALKSIVQTGDLSAAVTSGATVTAPSITALTTMVAETVAKANPTTAEVDAAKATVATVTGVAATDLYKNPMTNGDVFKAATLVNELVASGIKADPTQTPAGLVKAMAATTTAKLTDATLDPAKLMGLSTANAAIVQAQTSTIQAKADAMKVVAGAVTANVAVADQPTLTPVDAGRALAAALAGAQASDAAAAIAKAKLSQDTMKQMGVEMDALRKDTTVAATDLPAKMAAVVQGLEAVRIDQDAGITAAVGTPAQIATAGQQASGMVVGSAPALRTTVTGATVTNLQTSGYMEGAAASIISQIDPTKIAAAVTAAGGDATKIDFTSVVVAGVDPTKLATTATTAGTAASTLALTAPTALASYPALASQVVGMVIGRATGTNQLASANLQAWVNAIGTALAANSPTLLNPGSVGEAFEKLQPNLAAVPGTLTMTLAAEMMFTPSTTPITPTLPTETTTTAATTTTTAAATTTTAAATTTTAAATTTTAAPTTTTAVVVVTTTTATTTSSTTSTTAPSNPSLSLGVATPTGTFADEKTGLGVLAAGAVNYTGGVVTFGPYTVTGLSAATTMGTTGAVGTYTKFSVNGGAYAASGSVSNGDTITVQFDLPTYWTDAGPFGFSQTFNPRIRQTAATTIFQSFNAKLCSDPATPPETGNSQCK